LFREQAEDALHGPYEPVLMLTPTLSLSADAVLFGDTRSTVDGDSFPGDTRVNTVQ
jgi:hypothetical protein